MNKEILAIVFMLFIGCAGTGKKINSYDYNEGTIKAVFINGNMDTSNIIKNQNESIERILKKTNNKKGKITVLNSNSITSADYEIKIYLDSFYLVPYEIQKLKLNKKDSILTKLEEEQKRIDSAYKPLTTEERVAGSIATTVILNAALIPLGMSGFIILGEGEKGTASMSIHDKSYINKINFKPKLKGRIEITNKYKLIWSIKYVVDDKYDRFVTYEEQIEMLIRILIRNMRFYYKMPFLQE
jgi:hypothetical protein